MRLVSYVRYSCRLRVAVLVPCLVFVFYKFVIESRNDAESADFLDWINSTIGNLEQRRFEWSIIANQKKQRLQRLPDVIGIGVRKCGTGALHRFIGEHPLIRIAVNEAHFYDLHRSMGLEYYRQLMPNATIYERVSEKTPAYFRSRPNDLPNIIYKDIPGVKLWLLLCNPVQRAFSDFVMKRLKKKKHIDEDVFEQYVDRYMRSVTQLFGNWSEDSDDLWDYERVFDTLEKEKSTYTFAHGIYAYYIGRWLKVFPPDRLLIIDGEEHLNDPGTVIERLQDFIHIPKILLRKDFVRHPKTGLYCIRPWWDQTYDLRAEYQGDQSWENGLKCSSADKGRTRSTNTQFTFPIRLKRRLQNFFSPYNQRLFKILNRTFSW